MNTNTNMTLANLSITQLCDAIEHLQSLNSLRTNEKLALYAEYDRRKQVERDAEFAASMAGDEIENYADKSHDSSRMCF